MRIFDWMLKPFMGDGKATLYYQRGWEKACKRDCFGAIDSFTSAIGLRGVPTELKAAALYERGHMHISAGSADNAADDFRTILAMDESLVMIRTMAQQALAKIESRTRRVQF